MADRGDDTLRFGPLKPVGLRDPRTGKTPLCGRATAQRKRRGHGVQPGRVSDAVVVAGAERSLRKIPGLANAEWLRLGVMHRNTFIDSPRVLDAHLRLRGHDTIYFAGQITGAEGYVEAAACGAMAGIAPSRAILGLPPVEFPRDTAFGAVVAHLQNTASPDFQPANVTWAYFPELDRPIRDKKERRRLLAERALTEIDALLDRVGDRKNSADRHRGEIDRSERARESAAAVLPDSILR